MTELSQNPRATKASEMTDQPSTRNGNVVREPQDATSPKNRILQRAELTKGLRKTETSAKQDLSHFGRHD